MSVTLDRWCQLMAEVTPKNRDAGHSWICEVYRNGGKRICEVMTQEQFDAFYSTHSRWNSGRRKLSLNEIIDKSHRVLTMIGRIHNMTKLGENRVLGTKYDIEQDLENVVQFSSPKEMQEKVQHELEKIKEKEIALGHISTALMYMTKSAKLKQTERAKSLCGRIKCCSRSYNKDKVNAVLKEIPSIKEACRLALPAIHDRILLNMAGFEEAEGISKNDRVCKFDDEIDDTISPAKAKKFFTLAAVGNIWLSKYSPRIYQKPVGEKAEGYRERVIGLLPVWDLLIKNAEAVSKGFGQESRFKGDQKDPGGPLLLRTQKKNV